MIAVEGKGGIRASVVAHSISEAGKEILTYELEYPRFIHSEFLTHRQFSRNAASSRAIPVAKVIDQVKNNPAMPIHWGKNQSGMKAKSQLTGLKLLAARSLWKGAAKVAAWSAGFMNKAGLHKQCANRILEPFQFIKVVCTATEFENFFYLRDHGDAQPEIAQLAKVMLEARSLSVPQVLKAGEWHVPYVGSSRNCLTNELEYCTADYREGDCEDNRLSISGALALSASLCAQVSYRVADQSLEKAFKIYDQLVTMTPVHASPFEHQATPMKHSQLGICSAPNRCEEGVTHVDKYLNKWSGNFQGWVQHRQLIKGHVYTGEAG